MRDLAKPILCDGCGQPASPEHIAERLARLEIATRFRPIHISILFVAAAPSARVEEDFYSPHASSRLYGEFMNAVGIPPPMENLPAAEAHAARLGDFQHRGCYLAYLSECPLPREAAGVAFRAGELAERLGETLVRRIRHNYKPKHIGLIGQDTRQLIPVLQDSGLGGLMLLDRGNPLDWPDSGDAAALGRFRAVLATSTDRASAAPSV